MLDSGCSRHMTGDQLKFSKLTFKRQGSVAFGNNGKLKIIGSGDIELNSNFTIQNALLVENFQYNLLSVSQLCDNNYKVIFLENECLIKTNETFKTILKGTRNSNIYTISLPNSSTKCLMTQQEESWLWHRWLGHSHPRLIHKISQSGLVRGLPNLNNLDNKICNACQQGKKPRAQHQLTNQERTKSVLELLHLDLFDSHGAKSLNGSQFYLVIIDDYSRFTWVRFLKHKSDTLDQLTNLCKLIENQKNLKIKRLRSDHGGEFKNHRFTDFCNLNGYHHEFSCPRTPQQNGLVERKNRTLQEAARTMLNEYNLPDRF